VVSDLATARARLTTNVHLAKGCVVEPFRADLTDVQVALRTYPGLSVSAIEKPLRRSQTAEILDYRDKYVGGEGMVSAPRELPAVLAPDSASSSSRVREPLQILPRCEGSRAWTSSGTRVSCT